MKTLEETIATALDVTDRKIIPFLPYILQDFWEMGSNPETIISAIAGQVRGRRDLKVLDLGCGKGPVSIHIAKQLGYYCVGIDAIPEFIDQAIEKAKEYQVSDLCAFKVGDIRHEVKHLQDFDIIILGSIGQVFGDYYTTLTTLLPCLKADGLIIVDDGYIEDGSGFSHPQVLGKQEFYRQVDAAGMAIVEEIRGDEDDQLEENYDTEYRLIEKRCRELMLSYPEKATLFSDYAANQKREYNHLNPHCVLSRLKEIF